MQSLAIDSPSALLVPADAPITILLVGCGGTGSCLAPILARLVLHARAQGMTVDARLMDGDTVEARNVGRQLFAPAEIGRNKARVLADRLNAALGLDLAAAACMADAPLLTQCVTSVPRQTTILIGAVDTASGRRAMASTLQHARGVLWLDLGNTDRAGQIVLGTTTAPAGLRGALDVPGLCRALPAASLLFPNLLDDAPAPVLDCAAAVAANAQSLLINQLMASVAGEYLYQLIIERRVTRYRSVLDARTLTLTSRAITATNLQADLPDVVWQSPAKPKRTPRRRAA